MIAYIPKDKVPFFTQPKHEGSGQKKVAETHTVRRPDGGRDRYRHVTDPGNGESDLYLNHKEPRS